VFLKSTGPVRAEPAVGFVRDSVKSEELLRLLEDLRADEEDHLACLLALLHTSGADRPIVATRQPARMRSVGRMIPRDRPVPLD
jgi:hypothetical protein